MVRYNSETINANFLSNKTLMYFFKKFLLFLKNICNVICFEIMCLVLKSVINFLYFILLKTLKLFFIYLFSFFYL
jgi:hypothetical protein